MVSVNTIYDGHLTAMLPVKAIKKGFKETICSQTLVNSMVPKAGFEPAHP